MSLIYGSLKVVADQQVQISRSIEINWIQKSTSRKNSGSPGYTEMSPLKIGKLNTADPNKDPYIDEYSNGYVLRGADNTGKCYNIEKSLTTPQDTAKTFLIKNENEFNYFDDPLLTFEDSILTGCHLDLTYDELQKFCQDEQYKNMMIFQNLFGIKYIGKFGNSQPEFLKDWIQVETIPGVKTSTFDSGQCKFPSTGILRYYFQKIGRSTDPQFVITKADLQWTDEFK